MKNIKILSLVMALALAMGLLAGCGNTASQPEETNSVASGSMANTPAEENDEIVHTTLNITYADGSTKEFALECKPGDTLATAMLNAELVSKEEAEAGFITVLDGVEANYDADKAWWQLLDGEGQSSMVGCGEIVLEEGESYSFVYTIG